MSLAKGGRLQLLGVVALLLTFAAGAMGGVAVERVRRSKDPDPRTQQPDRRVDDCGRPASGHTPYDDLGLSDGQSAQIQGVLQKSRTRTDSLWQSYRPRWDSIIEGTRADIRTILTPEQRTEMDRRRTEWARRDSVRREERRQRCGTPQQNGDNRQGGRDGRGPFGPPRHP